MTDKKSFAVIGAGIGGLTVAIALQRKGFNVKVYENAASIKSLGAGLLLAANAVKALEHIGIDKEVLRVGKVMKRFSLKTPSGKVLNETDSEKISEKYGINSFAVHRADLHQVLLTQLHENSLYLNNECVDFKQDSNDVKLYFRDVSQTKADYVIAADGIHSVFRMKMIPSSLPRYAGYTCWRAVIDNFLKEFEVSETSQTWGAGCRFGMVPLTNRRLYWFACINANPNDVVKQQYKIADLLSYFSSFHSPIPEILKYTKNEQLIWGDIADIPPLSKFAFDRIVLMGDAAHATTPNMGQGACMAIEDAAVLATCVVKFERVEEAFKQFESKRINRTTRIVNASRTFGKIAQLESPLLMGVRNMVMRLTPSKLSEKQLDFLYNVSFS